MKVLVDTSAWITLADASDANHALAHRLWTRLRHQNAQLFVTSYIVLETIAVLQRRFGINAIPPFLNYLHNVEIEWVQEPLHQQGLSLLLQQNRRGLSLVDCVSFEFMQREAITIAFCFDAHFSEFGFQLLGEELFGLL